MIPVQVIITDCPKITAKERLLGLLGKQLTVDIILEADRLWHELRDSNDPEIQNIFKIINESIRKNYELQQLQRNRVPDIIHPNGFRETNVSRNRYFALLYSGQLG
jgi:hypothetical protein